LKSLYEYCAEQGDNRLLRQWHPTKNGKLRPEDVATYSNKKVWWVCEKGHEWETNVHNRTFNGSGCPYCAGQRVIPGENDLHTLYPEVAKQWHPDLNGNLTPQHVMARSRKSAWWRCEKGHKWQEPVYKRTMFRSGCPYCGGRKRIEGFNDLATENPALAAQWHPTKNGDLTPQHVVAGSAKKVWWVCEKGHEWCAVIYSRAQGSGCPYCNNRAVLEGFNDLTTTHPEVAKQWHPDLNGDLTPQHVMAGSLKKAWWVCEKGHAWEAVIASRAGMSSGCPYCSGLKALPGFNDLATVEPEIAAQWHPELNGDLTPEHVTRGSDKKAWWICSEGHVWKATIGMRAGKRKTGCPVCAGIKRKDRYKAIMDDKT
jgi:glutaredoxin